MELPTPLEISANSLLIEPLIVYIEPSVPAEGAVSETILGQVAPNQERFYPTTYTALHDFRTNNPDAITALENADKKRIISRSMKIFTRDGIVIGTQSVQLNAFDSAYELKSKKLKPIFLVEETKSGFQYVIYFPQSIEVEPGNVPPTNIPKWMASYLDNKVTSIHTVRDTNWFSAIRHFDEARKDTNKKSEIFLSGLEMALVSNFGVSLCADIAMLVEDGDRTYVNLVRRQENIPHPNQWWTYGGQIKIGSEIDDQLINKIKAESGLELSKNDFKPAWIADTYFIFRHNSQISGDKNFISEDPTFPIDDNYLGRHTINLGYTTTVSMDQYKQTSNEQTEFSDSRLVNTELLKQIFLDTQSNSLMQKLLQLPQNTPSFGYKRIESLEDLEIAYSQYLATLSSDQLTEINHPDEITKLQPMMEILRAIVKSL